MFLSDGLTGAGPFMLSPQSAFCLIASACEAPVSIYWRRNSLACKNKLHLFMQQQLNSERNYIVLKRRFHSRLSVQNHTVNVNGGAKWSHGFWRLLNAPLKGVNGWRGEKEAMWLLRRCCKNCVGPMSPCTVCVCVCEQNANCPSGFMWAGGDSLALLHPYLR